MTTFDSEDLIAGFRCDWIEWQLYFKAGFPWTYLLWVPSYLP